MAWPKGKPKGYKTGGRRKGSPQKIVKGPKSPELREMVLRALDDVGGQEYLRVVALTDHKAFLALVGRLLPTKVEGELTVPTEIRIITGFDSGPHER